jgi:hypothetical protein
MAPGTGAAADAGARPRRWQAVSGLLLVAMAGGSAARRGPGVSGLGFVSPSLGRLPKDLPTGESWIVWGGETPSITGLQEFLVREALAVSYCVVLKIDRDGCAPQCQ